jgi:hypothetical protein
MKVRPILVFMLTLVVVAPVIAIAGVVAWGNWTPSGLMIAGALVFWTGRRALDSARTAPTIAGIRLRMLAVLWIVIVVAALLSAGSAFWLGWRLVG